MTSPRTEADLEGMTSAVEALPQQLFSAYPGGWPGQISLALIDAVHSIRARYNSKNPGRGVGNRVKVFRDAHGDVVDDLWALAELGAPAIEEAMLRGKTSSRPKSGAVLEVAEGLCALPSPIVHASDFTEERLNEARTVYTSVHGLGKITFGYMAMNLGFAGVKPDSLVTRFVARYAYGDATLKLNPHLVTDLVKQAYSSNARGAKSLTHFEHALWKAESEGTASRVCATGSSE